MTSKGEAQETSEFLRRRQLRLQQVREQSKDIAKKLRQRAKVEKLRQGVELDEKKEKDYKQSQEKFVKKLEELYSKGLDNVGNSHKRARGLTQPVNHLEKTDLSHLRGREAVAEVKRQKQHKLDELKKSLDRKVQAREAANVLSRDKSACAANKLSTKPSIKKNNVNDVTKPTPENVIGDQDLNDKDSPEENSRIDMGTQWDIDLLPPEWEPNIPALAIPTDDDTKQSAADRDNSAVKQKKTNLFAISDEMPSSLRGSVSKPCDTAPSKLSSTLVSEYIQNRVLRLREPEVTSSKQHSENLKNMKQTIMRSRPLRPEGSAFNNICHVVEGQVFPVPSWQPETGQCQSSRNTHIYKPSPQRKQFSNITHSNMIYNSVCPVKHNLLSSPVSEKTRPYIPHKCCGHNELSGGNKDGSVRGKGSDNLLTKKQSITMYNHSTRDSRDVPRADERLVHRDRSSEDAYSRALSEAASATHHDKQKRTLDGVNKIAVTRQNVEKEYKDTMAFLNCLPKNKNTRLINNAFKDDHRLQARKENRQRVLQQEFKNIEEESRRLDSQGCKIKSRLPNRSPSKRSISPPDLNADNLNERDFRYSWMPVPESDSKLAVHTIPTGARPSVHFRADTYHEYRSRHKHTPPTRDVHTVVFQGDADSLGADSIASEDSSTDSRDSAPKQNNQVHDSPHKLTDTERIIIYKILNNKHRKKNKTCVINSTGDVAQNNEASKETDNENITKASSKGPVSKDVEHNEHVEVNNKDPLSTENLTEGVYEVAGNKQDNLESMYTAELEKNQSNNNDNKCDKRKQGPCSRRSDAGDGLQPRKKCSSAKCKGHCSKGQSAAAASPSNAQEAGAGAAGGGGGAAGGGAQSAALLKLIDEAEQRESNFYIGATGFLKHDAYEVIIQLRKNDTVKEMAKRDDVAAEQKTSDTGNENTANTNIEGSQSLEAKEDVQQKLTNDSNHSIAPAPPISGPDLVSVIATDVPAANSSVESKEPCLSNTTSDDVQHTKTMHDRSVSTSFKDTYPLTEPCSKRDPIPRPATSTCTQTTPSPPNTRPVYIHMSSSTSTAYMSPPEVVLPNFFRRGDKPCRKPRPSRNTDKNEERNLIRHEHHCKRYSSCKIFKKLTELKPEQFNFYAERYRERKASTLSSPASHVRNSRCSRYITRDDFDLWRKQHARKTKHHLNTDQLGMSVMCNTKPAIIMHSKKNKTNTHSGKLSSKSYLSPMIKEYIHKLLSLNREGIKTIQIINQDCSSVNTPASSIINVPTNLRNKNTRHRNLDIHDHDVSLEQFKRVLRKHVFLHNDATHLQCHPEKTTKSHNMVSKNIKSRKRNMKNKKLHKVKSLNISKKIVVKPSELSINRQARDDSCPKKHLPSNAGSPASPPSNPIKSYGDSRDKGNIYKTRKTSKESHRRNINQYVGDDSSSGQPKAATSSENNFPNSNDEIPSQAINTSTQTSHTPDGEINFIKLAEDKLQNMEKIADLTEKCTKRLSNLAKVLEEVRKNKSLAYSQVSTADSTSDSDQKVDKTAAPENADLKIPSTVSAKSSQIEYNVDSTDYEYLVPGVPKPDKREFPEIDPSENMLSENSNVECISKSESPVSTNDDCRVNNNARCRNKPPPALLRIHLKRPQDNVVPHELSTVIEVDSPLSVKLKQQSSSINGNQSASHLAGHHQLNSEFVHSVVNKSSNDKIKVTSSDSSEDSKLQMMDLNQFNEIMLRPFVSLQEYARDHYYDRNSNTKGTSVSKDIGLAEDISSLHSDGSLPDVVAELLKRKLITEPFRFDTASNVNSTTISSESTLSVLALSKIQKDKSRSKLSANKENLGETSDSLSMSSNPDLENAFKKLGLGWASSTLKKTKERLALSSSSNTSSSSLSQIKFKTCTKQEEPVADAGWSVSSISKKPVLKRRLDASKNVEQQTSFSNNMTVKEFLTKELAKKITFTDKSNRNDSNQEFVSLFETKLPEDLKNSSQTMLDDNSGDSAPSVNNNRARTSTPVNLFKCMTYHSSSSSNMSNGLFSNADDLSSVKLTSASMRYQSASEKDELTIPNCSLKMRKTLSDCSKTDSC